MLSIGKLSLGQSGYYSELATEDYYLDGGEPPGRWFGSGADELGLTGEIKTEEFSELFDGSLRGKKLVQGKPEKRVPGWDLTFSAPKSVSVIFSQADHAEAKLIREAQQAAVEKALVYMEEQCGFTRRGKGGRITEAARCLFATFEHGTSRAEQPHLHTHAVMPNVCVREDGTTGALKTQKFYQHRLTGGAVYLAELAYQLEMKLGVDILRDRFSFKVAGVSEELCDHFSKRRKEIEAKLDELGLSGAKASAAVTLTTRTSKENISRKELLEAWRETGREFGWSTEQVKEILGMASPQTEEILENQAVLSAIEATEHLMESASSFTELEAVRFTCEFSQGRGVSAEKAQAAIRETLKDARFVRLADFRDEPCYTTKEQLELERGLLADVAELREGASLDVPESVIIEAFGKAEGAGKPLTKEQEEAARSILEGEGQITTVVGDAGTGKTTMLKPVAEALTNSGYQVRGIALAGKAAEGLEAGSGIESGTVASFLWNQERFKEGWNEGEAKQDFEKWVTEKKATLDPEEAEKFNPVWTPKLAEQSKARFEERQQGKGLTDKTVLVLDEAAMVDTKSLSQIVGYVKEAGAKLVAIGDPKQLQAILQGGGFSEMAKVTEGTRLTEIFRQKNEEEKQAVREMADGSVEEALSHYAKEGRLKIAECREEAASNLIDDWSRQGVVRPADNLMLAGTNLDVHHLNEMAQEKRFQAGFLGGTPLEVDGRNFYEGDRIVFTKKQHGLGVQNGSQGTIRAIDPSHDTLSVEIDGEGDAEKRTRIFSLKQCSDFRLGYAVTTHKSQGMTVENAFILTDEAMAHRELAYVQVSRVEEKASLYTTREEAGEKLADLVRNFERSREKELALNLAREQQQEVLRQKAAQTHLLS